MRGIEMADGPLRFEILGPVRAYRGSEPVDVGPVKQQAVLAILLLHAGQPVPLPRIVAALWNGDPPENGVDVVQRYIGGLRRALDPERTSLLALTGGGYVLRVAEDAVDAGRLRAALARGHSADVGEAPGLGADEPLAGLTGPVFESARARLRQERAAAAELPAPATGQDDRRPPPAPEPAGPRPAAPAHAAAPTHAEPAHVEPPPEPTRPQPTRSEPTRPQQTRPQPTRVEPAAAHTHAEPAASHTRVEPAPTRVEPAPAPTRVEPVAAEPAYPEAVDPWAGHDLFPPDPLSMT